MALKEKIQEDLKEALKKAQKSRIMVLRLLLASILNKEKEKRYKIIKAEPELTEKELRAKAKLTDEEIIETISSEIKKRKEAILEFEKGKRLQPSLHPTRKKHILDLVQKEKKEMEVLKEYMPEQLSVKELKKLAKEVIEKVEAKELKDMGKVMGELMPQVKGRVEGSQVSKIVKELLSTK